jgi:hypothetical protein
MFKSIDALKQEFGFDPTVVIDEVVAGLKRRRAAIHPDKSDGEFLSEAAKLQYSRITEALNYIDEKLNPATNTDSTSLALAQSAEFPALAANIARLETAVEQLRLRERPEKQVREILRSDIKRFGRTAQITSAMCATAFTAVLAFSNRISGISALAPIANSNAVRICLAVLLGVSATAFAASWINELRLKEILAFLTSERGLSNALYWRVNAGPDKEPNTEMVKSEIEDDINEMGNRWRNWHRLKSLRWLRRLLRIRIPIDFANHAAESVLVELLERGVIFKKGTRGIQTLFGIDQLRAKEVIEERHEIYSPNFWRS